MDRGAEILSQENHLVWKRKDTAGTGEVVAAPVQRWSISDKCQSCGLQRLWDGAKILSLALLVDSRGVSGFAPRFVSCPPRTVL